MSDLHRLAQIVTERAAALTLYARQWLDRASAEDVVQEALTSLLAEPQEPDDTVAWMYRAVRNAAIDHSRSAGRRRRREQAIAASRPSWFESRVDSLIDAQEAETALEQLGADDRQIVVMRIWGELGFAEIARIMDLGVSTIHDRYRAALKELRSALEKPSCQNKTN